MKKVIKIIALLFAAIALLVFDVDLPIVGIPTDILGLLFFVLRTRKQLKSS